MPINCRLYIHVHHADSLLEIHPAYYFEKRLREFDELKATIEGEPPWKIDLRKKLFADVTDLLPPELDKALAELEEAWAIWSKAWAKWDEAIATYGLDRLHTELCLSRNPDCPWDGKTIFGRENNKWNP